MSGDLQSQVEALRHRVFNQAQELTILNEKCREKNRELDELHAVWCSGPCDRGFHRWIEKISADEIDELVKRTEIYLRRLKSRAWVQRRKEEHEGSH